MVPMKTNLGIVITQYDDSPNYNMTIAPTTLAKYSKYFNNGNNMDAMIMNSNGMTTKMAHGTLTPVSSPMKSSAANESTTSMEFFQPPQNYIRTSPSLAYSTPSSSPQKNNNSHNNPNIFRHNSIYGESESESYMSSSEQYFSPMDTSPELTSHPRFYDTRHQPLGTGTVKRTGTIVANNSNVSPLIPNVEVYSSVDMQQVDSNSSTSSVTWQPVLTAPSDNQSQAIIKTQQSLGKQSNRKSALPPGKVDSYMAGPNLSGLFECLFPNCNKLFRRRYNIRSHIQTHLCDRPYGCDICGACFVRPHDLRRHERCHKDERPFTCPCGKSFTRHDALQRHRIRMICSGGIEIPGRPKRVPAKRGRPRKGTTITKTNNLNHSNSIYGLLSSPETGASIQFSTDINSLDFNTANLQLHSSSDLDYSESDQQSLSPASSPEYEIDSYIKPEANLWES